MNQNINYVHFYHTLTTKILKENEDTLLAEKWKLAAVVHTYNSTSYLGG